MIVVGNRTPYALINKTVVIEEQDLLHIVMLPVIDEDNIALFTAVKDWHDGESEQCMPSEW